MRTYLKSIGRALFGVKQEIFARPPNGIHLRVGCDVIIYNGQFDGIIVDYGDKGRGFSKQFDITADSTTGWLGIFQKPGGLQLDKPLVLYVPPGLNLSAFISGHNLSSGTFHPVAILDVREKFDAPVKTVTIANAETVDIKASGAVDVLARVGKGGVANIEARQEALVKAQGDMSVVNVFAESGGHIQTTGNVQKFQITGGNGTVEHTGPIGRIVPTQHASVFIRHGLGGS